MRRAGILCHLTSLPRGTLGEDAAKFCMMIRARGCRVWQMLPITAPDEHLSPYASNSTFAINLDLANPDIRYSLDYEQLDKWVKRNHHWLEDWALYEALKEGFGGKPWTEWPSKICERDPVTLKEIKQDLEHDMSAWMRNQFIVETDWGDLRRQANDCRVELFGDLPFFLAHDSADVWANQHLLLLEESGAPAVVAGVPPDYFSEEGQRWGPVLYDWEAHRAEGFRWWKARMKRMFELFDMVRIDHFRAIDSAWEIPAHHPTAEHGKWVEGPGDELLEAILAASPDGGLVAEDLGIIPDSVAELRKKHGIPGMAVLQFANDDSDNPHNPENHTEDMVVYTGTHDNDTTVGWGKKPVKDMITTVLQSPAELAIIPLQDLMGLESKARMNTPGTQEGNWEWRFDWDELNDDRMKWFGEAVKLSGR